MNVPGVARCCARSIVDPGTVRCASSKSSGTSSTPGIGRGVGNCCALLGVMITSSEVTVIGKSTGSAACAAANADNSFGARTST